MQTANEKVTVFLQANPNATKAAISESTEIKGIVLHNLLRKMEKEELIISEGIGPDMVFNLKTVEEEKEEEIKIEIPFYRDNSKYKFNGETYGKGPLVRAVVKQHVQDNPKITINQLKDIFPDELLRRYGIFQEENIAREISGKRDRYFLKAEHLIQLKKEKIAVCSQFTFENIQPFLKLAKGIGYKIK